MRLIGLWLGKVIYRCLRLIGRRGATLPGLVVERLFPGFMAGSLASISGGVIIITGTNGKTTSTKMLAHVLRSDRRVLTNPTGSNFIRGVVASIIQHSDWSGRLPYDIAVFELDEAYAAQFSDVFRPRATVVLNVMRDQMDRFGEIDHTAKLIEKVVSKSTEFVILNRDDPRVAAMAASCVSQVYYFGVAAQLRDLYRNDDELHADALPQAGYIPATAELLAYDVKGLIDISLAGEAQTFNLAAASTYNAQNAVAVCTTAWVLGVQPDVIFERLSSVKPAFGRGEQISLGSKKLTLQLVKNPGGFRHALISGSRSNYDLTLIAINDDYADGRDVSWLWDVAFAESHGLFNPLLTSGNRAADMALRLKYDDIPTVAIEPDLETCLKMAVGRINDHQSIMVYTTYTAMLELRKILSKMTEVEKV